jgi:hypothetical protein
MLAIAIGVGVGGASAFVVGLLLGQWFSHHEVHLRERELAAVRRQRNELARELRQRPRRS